jgi:hypothetical protein
VEKGRNVIVLRKILDEFYILLGELVYMLAEGYASRIHNREVVAKNFQKLYLTILEHGCLSRLVLKPHGVYVGDANQIRTRGRLCHLGLATASATTHAPCNQGAAHQEKSNNTSNRKGVHFLFHSPSVKLSRV